MSRGRLVADAPAACARRRIVRSSSSPCVRLAVRTPPPALADGTAPFTCAIAAGPRRAGVCGWRTPWRALLARAARYRHRRPRSGNAAARTRARALDGAGMAPSTRVRRASVVRRCAAGGPLRARLCAGFVDGAANTNACPSGSSKIGSEAACAGAAGVLGRAYGGIFGVRSPTPDWPSGCFSVGPSLVSFNAHPTGAPLAKTQPLCAGTPAA
jgi:hypothetical protein